MGKHREVRQVHMVPIGELRPYERNSRTHSDAQIDQIIASLNEFGWTNPVLVDEGLGVIAGHARVEAAKRMGYTDVPCIKLSGLSEAQKRAYIIADNKLALNAGWDEKLLALEFEDLKAFDFNLDLTGFRIDEIDALLAKADASAGLTDPDAVPEAPKVPASILGDLWLLGRHRLLCGDSTNPQHVDRLMGGVVPLLMVTDPPYGVEYDPQWRAEAGINKNKSKMGKVSNDDRADWRDAWSLFTGSVAYIWHADRHASEVQQSLEACDFQIVCQIIWAKDRFALSRGDYHWQHEPCWYAVKKGSRHNWGGLRNQSTLWSIKAREDGGSGHGTQKPVECMRRPIENNSNAGQCVYDPFLGSGTTLIAAESTGRIGIGMELDPIYCDVIVDRWQQFTGKKATLDGDGRTFDEVKNGRVDSTA
jgi:DNA modification methylase